MLLQPTDRLWRPTRNDLEFISDQHNDHGRAIEEAKRDLDVFKKAYMNSERAKQEAEERFEKEKDSSPGRE